MTCMRCTPEYNVFDLKHLFIYLFYFLLFIYLKTLDLFGVIDIR